MNNKIEGIVSSRQCGKTLKQWEDFIEQIRNWETDDYILYIDKDFYNKYKNEIDLIDVEIEITTNLPKYANGVYIKKYWKDFGEDNE